MSFTNPERTPVAARTRLLAQELWDYHTRTACAFPFDTPLTLSGFSTDSAASCMERPRPCGCMCTGFCRGTFGTTVSCIARELEFDDPCDANLDILSAFVRCANEGDIQGRFKVDEWTKVALLPLPRSSRVTAIYSTEKTC